MFNNFKISQKAQHKVLIIGILSTIITRFLIISAGVYLIQKFQWVFYIFGTFLIYSGIKIMGKEERKEEQSNSFISFFKKLLPISEKDHGDKFTVKIKGKRYFTSLFIVLLIIEKVDLIFALDSIPAILAITGDIFIVLTSNIFAILGLRSMYFFLSGILESFILYKACIINNTMFYRRQNDSICPRLPRTRPSIFICHTNLDLNRYLIFNFKAEEVIINSAMNCMQYNNQPLAVKY